MTIEQENEALRAELVRKNKAMERVLDYFADGSRANKNQYASRKAAGEYSGFAATCLQSAELVFEWRHPSERTR